MSERLLSVGLDVGTTSTQMILSELTVENRAGSFSVPELEIGERKIRYQSPIHFTPLLDESHVDAASLRQIIQEEYRKAGIRRKDVDTGALIITGETSRKENARAVLGEISGFAGDFVVATAGPHLESVLAAKGSGAVEESRRTGKRLLHIDIGGGTSNLALIQEGKILATGCLNVGGRLVKFDETGVVTYVSPVLRGRCALAVGDQATEESVTAVAEMLTQTLEMAVGLRPATSALEELTSREAGALSTAFQEKGAVISLSGGVAECVRQDIPWLEYGDLGPVLGRAIRESALCRGECYWGEQTIRATVIGAGCHSAQLSGSTVFCQNVALPLKNLPVLAVPEEAARGDLASWLKGSLEKQEELPVLALPRMETPGYAQVRGLAERIALGWGSGPVILCLEQDMAKALGQALAVRMGPKAAILCIDRVRLEEGSYLDVGAPVGPALPVVVKTLVLSR